MPPTLSVTVSSGHAARSSRRPPRADVAAKEQDRCAARIEREQRSHVAAVWAKLLHVRMARAFERVDQRAPERRTALLEQLDSRGHALLLLWREPVPPCSERVGV